MKPLEHIDAWYWFYTPLKHSVDHWVSELSPSDQSAAQRYSNPIALECFVMSRKMRNDCLKKWVPAPLETKIDTMGKPHIKEEINPYGIHFNISHTPGCILLAVGPTPLGVDVEKKNRSTAHNALAKKHFHPKEHSMLMDEKTSERFIRIWTCKEALAKALGTGVYESFRNTVVVDIPRPTILEPNGWILQQKEHLNHWLTLVHQESTPFSNFQCFTPNS